MPEGAAAASARAKGAASAEPYSTRMPAAEHAPRRRRRSKPPRQGRTDTAPLMLHPATAVRKPAQRTHGERQIDRCFCRP
jgi:hypothetical protein